MAGTVEINGETVFVDHIETVADGVSHKFDRQWDSWTIRMMNESLDYLADVYHGTGSGEKPEPDYNNMPREKDYPAVIVKLTSGREFRIVGKTRQEVEDEIMKAKENTNGT